MLLLLLAAAPMAAQVPSPQTSLQTNPQTISPATLPTGQPTSSPTVPPTTSPAIPPATDPANSPSASLSISSAASSNTLDLAQALAAAAQNNLELRAARQQRALAIAGGITARQLPNPTITFGAARDAPHENLLLDQPLEIGGQRGLRIAVAQEEQRSTELDIAMLERQVRRRTREAFFRSLIARAQSAQMKDAFALASRTENAVKQRFDAGDVAEIEVIQAQVEQLRAQADYEFAVQSQRAADAQLGALLARPIVPAANTTPAPYSPPAPSSVAPMSAATQLSLSGDPAAMPPLPTLDQVTEKAMQSNSDITRTAQDLRTEEKRLALARSLRVPNLDLQAGVDLNSGRDFNVGPRGQVALQVPLFYRGQGEIALSNARIELLRLTLSSQRTNAAAQVAAAYFDFEGKLHQAQQYRDRIMPQSVRLEQMAQDSYQSGKSDLLTLIDAQRRLNDLRKAYLDSLFAAQSSFAALEEATGAPLD